MAEIPLTQNQVALIDDEDLEAVSRLKWYAAKLSNDQFYAISSDGSFIYLHHYVLRINNIIIPKGMEVDHINRNTLDDHKNNLRIATRSIQRQNSRKAIGMTSRFVGVSFNGRKEGYKRWRAQTRFNGNHIHIGDFKTQEEAALAYDEKAIELWGELARTNKSLGLL